MSTPRDLASSMNFKSHLHVRDDLNSYVNHTVKQSKQRKKQADLIDKTLSNYVTPGKHQDSISRLHESLIKIRS